jgi:hypothetical protein
MHRSHLTMSACHLLKVNLYLYLIKQYAMKKYGGGRIDPRFLGLGISCR